MPPIDDMLTEIDLPAAGETPVDDTPPDLGAAEPPADATPPESGGDKGAPPSPDAAATDPPAAASPPTNAKPETPPPAAPEKPERTVPLAALLEERRRADERVAAAERRLADIEAKLKPAATAEETAEAPEFVEDPKGYVDAAAAKLAKALEELKTQGTQELEQTRNVAAEARFKQDMAIAESAIAAAAPDYTDALLHVRVVRAEQLKMLAPDATDEQIIKQIEVEERQLAARELGAGRNPYAFIYRTARLTGYQPKAAAAPAGDAGKGATPPAAAGKAPAATPPAAKVVPPDTTLSATNGSAEEGDATDDEEESTTALNDAIAERFGRKRA